MALLILFSDSSAGSGLSIALEEWQRPERHRDREKESLSNPTLSQKTRKDGAPGTRRWQWSQHCCG